MLYHVQERDSIDVGLAYYHTVHNNIMMVNSKVSISLYFKFVCVYVCTCVRACVRVCVCVCICVHVYICTHIISVYSIMCLCVIFIACCITCNLIDRLLCVFLEEHGWNIQNGF